jgi:hypothetical protein
MHQPKGQCFTSQAMAFAVLDIWHPGYSFGKEMDNAIASQGS